MDQGEQVMSWYIDKDLIDGGESEGRWNGIEQTIEQCKRHCTHKFRMLDDDGNLYYEGYSDDCDGESAFDPLDDYGTPNAGCTEIQYKNGVGKWETL